MTSVLCHPLRQALGLLPQTLCQRPCMHLLFLHAKFTTRAPHMVTCICLELLQNAASDQCIPLRASRKNREPLFLSYPTNISKKTIVTDVELAVENWPYLSCRSLQRSSAGGRSATET